MQLFLPDIIKATKATVKTASLKAFDIIKVKEIVFDTRKVQVVEDALFLCLAKNPSDILHHIKKAEDKDIRIFLVPRGLNLPKNQSIYLEVSNVIEAIQRVATWHRGNFTCQVIGITGSNGKTIIKEWLSQVLEISYVVTKSPASYNSQLGVPLSVLQLHEKTDFGIFEAGISKHNEMQNLQAIIDCDLGILTNIGDAHDAGFANHQDKLIQKLQLFKAADRLIFEETDWIIKPLISRTIEVDLVSWSLSNKLADYFIVKNRGRDHTVIHFYGKHELTAILYHTDMASVKNGIHVVVACLELGIEADYIIDKLRYLESVSMRMTMKKALRNCLIIDDSYNADLLSLENALDFALEQKKHQQLHLILTEFDQINQDEIYFQKLGTIVSRYDIDRISYIGQGKPVLIHSDKIQYYQDSAELKYVLQNTPPEDEVILLKGARRFRLDTLVAEMQSKSHRTEFSISLEAIKNNIRYFRSIASSSTKIMAVIKAEAYGSSSVSLAKHLLRNGIEYFAVAYYDEAIELRKEGISAPIMVMNPDPQLTYLAEQNNLELEVYSMSQLERILSFAKYPLKIHIKIDSGMHRLGFVYEEMNALKALVLQSKKIILKSVFSHFSSADDPEADAFTRDQFLYYQNCYEYLLGISAEVPASLFELPKEESSHIDRHICNTNAAIRFPKYHLDMIRLGIGLYGYIDEPSIMMAHQLKTYVAQVKSIKMGDSVGYNRSFIAEKDMQVATLCIGYADGISRKLGNGRASFMIQGTSVKTVGHISMDTCSVDITGLTVQQGDEVTIYDSYDSFMKLADISEQSSYEFISGIGSRVVRLFVK